MVCVGNSLALAADAATARRAIAADARRRSSRRRGRGPGAQTLASAQRPLRLAEAAPREVAGGEALIVKGVHRAGGSGVMLELMVTDLRRGGRFAKPSRCRCWV